MKAIYLIEQSVVNSTDAAIFLTYPYWLGSKAITDEWHDIFYDLKNIIEARRRAAMLFEDWEKSKLRAAMLFEDWEKSKLNQYRH